MKKKRIVFRLIDKNTSGYELPRALTQQRIPNDVVYKLDKLIRQFMKVVVKAAVPAIKAAVAAAQELVAAVAACGGAVIAVVLVLCLVAALLMSPMGVFLSGEENGGGTMASVVREINQEYDEKIEELKAGITCDEVVLSGSRVPWPEVLAVYAVKTTSDTTNGQEVVTMDDTKKELLKQVF